MPTSIETRDGRRLLEREHPQESGECADCGKHVDPNDPELYTRLANTGLEPRTDEQGLRDDEELAVRGTSYSMGSETGETRAPEQSVNADAGVWDGSCYHCGASAGRVGRPAAAS
jgi:hypothetical protein